MRFQKPAEILQEFLEIFQIFADKVLYIYRSHRSYIVPKSFLIRS